MPFRNRADAGRRLVALLDELAEPDVVVLGLPRGGVAVAYEVALGLDAPLDVIVVRKLGTPGQPELAAGAIGEDGVRIVNAEVCRAAGIDEAELERLEARERAELEERVRRYRGGRRRLDVAGRSAVIVDDGMATGSTARAACRVARAHGAKRVVLAVPVAPPSTLAKVVPATDEVVCLETPSEFVAVGRWYDDFSAVTDEEVVELLGRRSAQIGRGRGGREPAGDGFALVLDEEVEVELPARRGWLAGRLGVPPRHRGVVVFAHGSGSGRRSPRNRLVAGVLQSAGFATLLADLLGEDEAAERANVFDVDLLAGRLGVLVDWVGAHPELRGSPVGLFGASTGAAAALRAAAAAGPAVSAVVSRGGRPDLAGASLAEVRAPTLLVVGGADLQVLDLNRVAQRAMRCKTELVVVPGATHLFEEPGALELVAQYAAQWFLAHLGSMSGPGAAPRTA